MALAPIRVLASEIVCFEHPTKVSVMSFIEGIAILNGTAINKPKITIGGEPLNNTLVYYVPSDIHFEFGARKYGGCSPGNVSKWGQDWNWLAKCDDPESEVYKRHIIRWSDSKVLSLKGEFLSLFVSNVLNVAWGEPYIGPKLSMLSICRNGYLSLRSVGAPLGLRYSISGLNDGIACLDCGPYAGGKEGGSNHSVDSCGDGSPQRIFQMSFVALSVLLFGGLECAIKGIARAIYFFSAAVGLPPPPPLS